MGIERSNGYLIPDIDSGTVIVSRYVRFNESVFPECTCDSDGDSCSVYAPKFKDSSDSDGSFPDLAASEDGGVHDKSDESDADSFTTGGISFLTVLLTVEVRAVTALTGAFPNSPAVKLTLIAKATARVIARERESESENDDYSG